MNLKSILLTAVATISLASATMAQVPNYVPTNGLIAWWPFNGNANDESGNGNNGTVNGASLTNDRFGNNAKAYSFDGINDIINASSNNFPTGTSSRTLSFWYLLNSFNQTNDQKILVAYGGGLPCADWTTSIWPSSNFPALDINFNYVVYSYTSQLNNWYNYVVTFDSTNGTAIIAPKIYINGVLQTNQNAVNNTCLINTLNSLPLIIGGGSSGNSNQFFNGKIDDIGIWNRALTQQEITDLYNAVNCTNNTTITPQTNSLPTGSTATFTATTSDPNPSYVWQSDLGQGFQTLNNFGNYSGVNTSTLNIANVQLPNHTQPIRVISTSGNCIDTSNVAVINILDTCLVTVYDTLLTTVTDTLVINTQITGINPPNNLNTLKVYPNPASTHITIDYGNFNAMNGYTLTIVNSIGQTVFTTPINQQTSYIDLSTWTGTGIYFVQLIDPQNNTIENRKIVIQ